MRMAEGMKCRYTSDTLQYSATSIFAEGTLSVISMMSTCDMQRNAPLPPHSVRWQKEVQQGALVHARQSRAARLERFPRERRDIMAALRLIAQSPAIEVHGQKIVEDVSLFRSRGEEWSGIRLQRLLLCSVSSGWQSPCSKAKI